VRLIEFICFERAIEDCGIGKMIHEGKMNFELAPFQAKHLEIKQLPNDKFAGSEATLPNLQITS